jgi:hypothetical protein
LSGRIAPLLVAASAGLAVAGAPGEAPPSFEREIEAVAAGRVAVRLDRDVYEAARADLGDLRVVDGRGREVAYVIDRGELRAPVVEVRPGVRNRGWRADGAATAVLDFGRRLAKHRLALRLSGDNFRRRVRVEGGEGAEWVTLVEEAWVFAVPGMEPFRYETVDLPENDFSRLRVVVHPSPDEKERPAIEDAWVPAERRPPRRSETWAPRWSEARNAKTRETWLTLDLGARRQPFHAVELAVADGRFLRDVRVEARREAPDGKGPAGWEEIGRGAIHRFDREGRVRERLTLDVCGRERVVRLRVRNLDDRPLTVVGVTVHAPVERVLFEAEPQGRYRLTYGAAGRTAPSYDLARTAGDAFTWGEAARPAGLGPPRRLATREGGVPPWTERHPALLWIGLVAAVVALGGLTYRALRRAG